MPEGHQVNIEEMMKAELKYTQELKPPKYVRSPRNSMYSKKSNMARKQRRVGMGRTEQEGDREGVDRE